VEDSHGVRPVYLDVRLGMTEREVALPITSLWGGQGASIDRRDNLKGGGRYKTW